MIPVRTRRLALLVLLGASLGACRTLHLQYDYGRAYVDTLRMQADLTRPSAMGQDYQLYGIEGIKIRVNVTAEATDQGSDKQTVDLAL